jgi:hypothetical protein
MNRNLDSLAHACYHEQSFVTAPQLNGLFRRSISVAGSGATSVYLFHTL